MTSKSRKTDLGGHSLSEVSGFSEVEAREKVESSPWSDECTFMSHGKCNLRLMYVSSSPVLCGNGNSVSLSLYSTVYEHFGYFSVRLLPCGPSNLLIKKNAHFFFLRKMLDKRHQHVL